MFGLFNGGLRSGLSTFFFPRLTGASMIDSLIKGNHSGSPITRGGAGLYFAPQLYGASLMDGLFSNSYSDSPFSRGGAELYFTPKLRGAGMLSEAFLGNSYHRPSLHGFNRHSGFDEFGFHSHGYGTDWGYYDY